MANVGDSLCSPAPETATRSRHPRPSCLYSPSVQQSRRTGL